MVEITDLPCECLVQILSLCSVKDILAFSITRKECKELARDDHMWEGFAKRHWGTSVKRPLVPPDATCESSIGPPDSTTALQSTSKTTKVIQALKKKRSNPSKKGKDCASSEDAIVDSTNEGTKAAEAPEAPQMQEQGWFKYCLKRLALHTIKASPMKLLQESYPDPWHHIACCILMSRTSGGIVIRDTVALFFNLFPTPTAVIEADADFMISQIRPLGMQENRVRALQRMSLSFLQTDFDCPSEFYGCGEFVAASWRIFCRGNVSGKNVKDPTLRSYLSWLKSSTVVKSESDRELESTSEVVTETVETPAVPRPVAKPRKRKAKEMVCTERTRKSFARSVKTKT